MSPFSQLRRQSRELALQVLFQKEYVKSLNLNEALNHFKKSIQAEEGMWSYAEKLLNGIQLKTSEIDSAIRSSSANWSLERMALVDINILRIAVFEMLFLDQPPPSVVINEALEIAKKYGTNDSASFINGILDQVLKTQKA